MSPARVSRLASLAIVLLAGCNSYTIVDTNQFMNDDGERAIVSYGRSDKNHIHTFRSPANGQELEFPSKLVVEAELPDGESFTAWQTMNFVGSGTLYLSDDREWLLLVQGFICRIAQEDASRPEGYREVFKGVLCNTPIARPEKDNRWYKVRNPEKRADD